MNPIQVNESSLVYEGDGSTEEFDFGLGFFDPADIKVTVTQDPAWAGTITNVSGVTFRLNPAPANGAVVLLYRESAIDAPLNEFPNRSYIRHNNLDENALQAIRLLQEAKDRAARLQTELDTLSNEVIKTIDTVVVPDADGNVDLTARYMDLVSAQSVSGQKNFNIIAVNQIDGKVSYVSLPTIDNDLDITNKKFVDDAITSALGTGVYKTDGSVPMDGGYAPSAAKDLVTLEYLEANSGVQYQGFADPTATAPTPTAAGDFWIANVTGTVDPSWAGLSGTITEDSLLVWNGIEWSSKDGPDATLYANKLGVGFTDEILKADANGDLSTTGVTLAELAQLASANTWTAKQTYGFAPTFTGANDIISRQYADDLVASHAALAGTYGALTDALQTHTTLSALVFDRPYRVANEAAYDFGGYTGPRAKVDLAFGMSGEAEDYAYAWVVREAVDTWILYAIQQNQDNAVVGKTDVWVLRAAEGQTGNVGTDLFKFFRISGAGNLQSDGSVVMDASYQPTNATNEQSVATLKYVRDFVPTPVTDAGTVRFLNSDLDAWGKEEHLFGTRIENIDGVDTTVSNVDQKFGLADNNYVYGSARRVGGNTFQVTARQLDGRVVHAWVCTSGLPAGDQVDATLTTYIVEADVAPQDKGALWFHTTYNTTFYYSEQAQAWLDTNPNAGTGVSPSFVGAIPLTGSSAISGPLGYTGSPDLSAGSTLLSRAAIEAEFLPLTGGSLTGDLSVTGNITASGDITAFSDRNLKDNFALITDALGKVRRLNGMTYTMKGFDDRKAGLIAQDVQAVLPEAVKPQGEVLSVNYNGVIALLCEAVSELADKVDKLEK